MARYDSAVIHEFADSLYFQAELGVLTYTIGGLAVGVGLGNIISETVGAIIGAVFLGALGYFSGQSRAFQLKLEAQVALCQVQIEENTRRVSGAQGPLMTTARSSLPQAQDTFRWQDSTPARSSGTSASSTDITEQERQLLELFAQELTITEISAKMGLSDDRVMVMFITVRQKLGVHSNIEMIKKAKERGYF